MPETYRWETQPDQMQEQPEKGSCSSLRVYDRSSSVLKQVTWDPEEGTIILSSRRGNLRHGQVKQCSSVIVMTVRGRTRIWTQAIRLQNPAVSFRDAPPCRNLATSLLGSIRSCISEDISSLNVCSILLSASQAGADQLTVPEFTPPLSKKPAQTESPSPSLRLVRREPEQPNLREESRPDQIIYAQARKL